MAVSEEQNQQEANHSVNESELEQYGVWVKAGPEDVIEAEAEDEAFTLDDLSADALGEDFPDAAAGADGLEDELEEISLDTLEDDTLEEDAPGEEAGTEEEELETQADILTLEEADLTLDADEEGAELGTDLAEVLEPEPEPVEAEAAGSVQGLGDLDEALSMEEDLPEDLNDLKLDLDDLDVDAFEEATEGASESPETPIEPGEEVSPELEEVPDEVEDLDLSSLPAEEEGFGEISPDELVQEDEGGLPELSGEEDILDLDEVDEEPAEEILDLEPEGDVAGADEVDLGIELEGETMLEEEPVLEHAARADDERSLSLLENIEHELTSIRSELSDLKRELGELRGAPVTSAPSPEAAAEEEPAGGFFTESEDDDETIALTGAELDNIMNTAEITEEAGQPDEIDDMIAPEAGPVLDELVPEADEAPAPVTEISLEEPVEENEPLEIDLDGSDEATLGGSEDEVEALASMDIDAELADIEDLEDESESMPDVGESLPDLDVGDEPEETSDDALADDALEVEELDELDELDLADENAAELDIETDRAVEADIPVQPQTPPPPPPPQADTDASLPDNLKSELKSVLSYMDQLLESLPEEKIQEFAQSEHFTVYRRLFEELGLEQ